ncbi:MAG TPA: ATP-binding protein, partial [Pseudohaliea sp.]|nr:ATP-binding protein [Pseudohaliea sp.]
MSADVQLRDPQLRRTRRQVQWTLAGFILLMVGALAVNVHLATRLGGVYTPMLHALSHVKMDLTQAHLWLEEMLTGTEEPDYERVFGIMANAEDTTERLLVGERIHLMPVAPPVDGDLTRPVNELHAQIQSLVELAELRWELRSDQGSLLELDRRYDALYNQIIALGDSIEDSLEIRINDDLSLFQNVQLALILGCLLLLVYGAWFTSRNITRLGLEVEQRRLTEQQLTRSREAALAARDEAKAANSAKDLFLAKISHEVRTPINAAMGMVTLLADGELEPIQRECVQAIDSEMSDLKEIVDDLLDFSSIEAGRVNLSPVPFDLRRLVAEAADHAASLAAGREVEVDAVVPHEFPAKVVGDPVRVRQVLLNLLRNAVKFTERGRILVQLDGRFSGHGGYVDATVSVQDTGIGVPRDQREEIFNAFSQGEGSRTRRFGGTGLGLTIAR